MTLDDISARLGALQRQVEELRAEADIRRVQARYMFLCDTPCPEAGVEDDAERINRILDLYTEDAVWEGVGSYYDNQFGRCVGKAAIRTHFEGFWGTKRDPELMLNVHYLTSEQIHVRGDQAEGQWVHCQPWIFSDGSSLLRSSRLNNAFRKVGGVWKVSCTRTENVFVAPLRAGWAESIPQRSVLMRA
ncbi:MULTISPECIES: nuclear transport factor 2 family protein [unclassified Bradyrhizobium]|uniref:nuclear transport factor 2 family protein n=1 Tax=unclassified Bradyrhizobium TaxID=2631580 RepID=UPI00244D7585|nr:MULTISPECIES: nuclear transport factor 2 family protein [unclassified Bradyrhizobium]MDH2346145.1 nuclear transport factor 2 family protein [Bradyrhizobium sp. SSUT77]MDH2350481.1 nuclear transport factor 2 family protein [Bradyrhizobium sp. SSUT112]